MECNTTVMKTNHCLISVHAKKAEKDTKNVEQQCRTMARPVKSYLSYIGLTYMIMTKHTHTEGKNKQTNKKKIV